MHLKEGIFFPCRICSWYVGFHLMRYSIIAWFHSCLVLVSMICSSSHMIFPSSKLLWLWCWPVVSSFFWTSLVFGDCVLVLYVIYHCLNYRFSFFKPWLEDCFMVDLEWDKFKFLSPLGLQLRLVVSWCILLLMPQVWPNLDAPVKLYCNSPNTSYFWPTEKSELV